MQNELTLRSIARRKREDNRTLSGQFDERQKHLVFRQANSIRDLAPWSLVQGRRLLHHWT